MYFLKLLFLNIQNVIKTAGRKLKFEVGKLWMFQMEKYVGTQLEN